jgi:hypothetical protein
MKMKYMIFTTREKEAVVALIQSMNQNSLILVKRVQALVDRLAKNSQNNSNLLTCDGLNKSTPMRQQKRHGRKSGGQPGWSG